MVTYLCVQVNAFQELSLPELCICVRTWVKLHGSHFVTFLIYLNLQH
jgi:hypothetical protein